MSRASTLTLHYTEVFHIGDAMAESLTGRKLAKANGALQPNSFPLFFGKLSC